jgi:hypothetical protein
MECIIVRKSLRGADLAVCGRAIISFRFPLLTRMGARMNAWLQQQQRRFMRPDGGRYLRPNVARYLAPERKWDGQPRIEAGEEGGGQFTFGAQDGEAQSNDGQTRVYIPTPRDNGAEGEGAGGGGSNGLDDFFIAASASSGYPRNGGPSWEDPPEIPEIKPPTSSDRTAFARRAAKWISAALRAGAAIPAALFIGALNGTEWLEYYNSSIESYRDPPRTLEELQAGVGRGRPGYDDHHIIEQTAAQRWGLTRSEINDKSNIVSIPRLKHYQTTGWFQKANPDFGGLSPRQYLSDKGIAERRAIGLRALKLYEVLKP